MGVGGGERRGGEGEGGGERRRWGVGKEGGWEEEEGGGGGEVVRGEGERCGRSPLEEGGRGEGEGRGGGTGRGGDGGWRGPWTSSRAGPDDVCAQRRPRSTRLLCGRDSGRGRTWARQTQDSMHAAAEDRRSGHGIATEVASGSSHRALGRRCARVVVAGVGDGQVKLRSPPRQCPCMRRLAPPTRTTHGSARVAWVARPLAGGGREHCGRGDRDMRMSAQWRGPPRASSPRPSGSTPPRACSARLAARPPRGSPDS